MSQQATIPLFEKCHPFAATRDNERRKMMRVQQTRRRLVDPRYRVADNRLLNKLSEFVQIRHENGSPQVLFGPCVLWCSHNWNAMLTSKRGDFE